MGGGGVPLQRRTAFRQAHRQSETTFVKQNQKLVQNYVFIFEVRGLFGYVVQGGEIAIVAQDPRFRRPGPPPKK